MRSALIIASFALTLLAAPVPVSEDNLLARADLSVDKRIQRVNDGVAYDSFDKRIVRQKNGKREEDDLEERTVRRPNAPGGKREVEEEVDDAELDKRIVRQKNGKRGVSRFNGKREEDDDADLDKRIVRQKNGRRDVDELEARSGRWGAGKREEDVEDEEDDAELEKRIVRQKNGKRGLVRQPNGKREEEQEEDDAELEKRIVRQKNGKREEDVEDEGDDAELEKRIVRQKNGKRGIVRQPNGKRGIVRQPNGKRGIVRQPNGKLKLRRWRLLGIGDGAAGCSARVWTHTGSAPSDDLHPYLSLSPCHRRRCFCPGGLSAPVVDDGFTTPEHVFVAGAPGVATIAVELRKSESERERCW